MNEVEEEAFEIEEEERKELEGIDYFYNIDNNFVKHLTGRPEQELQAQFQVIPSPIHGSILQATSEYYEMGSFAPAISVSTLQIREELIGSETQFPYAQLISGRESILFTSRSPEERTEFREQFAMAASGFILQHFVLKEEIQHRKIQNRASTANGIGEDVKLPSLFTYSQPGVLVITPTAHEAWRVNQAILGCIPNLIETNIRNRRKLDKYAPDSDEQTFKCQDMYLLPDEIPDQFLPEIHFQKCSDFYITNVGNEDSNFFFGFSFFRQIHKIDMMSRIRKSDVLYGSIARILEYGKYREEEEDFSFLSGIHTVYIEDIDRIATDDIIKLKTVLAQVARRPKMIQYVDVTLLTPNCKNLEAIRSVQFVCSERAENEFSNALFDASLYNAPFDIPKETVDETKAPPLKEGDIDVALVQEANCARNQMGMIKLNMIFEQSVFDKLVGKVLVQKIFEREYISTRRTDDLPEGVIKFNLAEHHKLDYLLNKEMAVIDGPICIMLPDMMVYERFVHITKRLKIRISPIPLGSTREAARKEIKRIKKNLTHILVLTEDEMRRNWYVLPKFKKMVFYSPPREYEMLRYMLKTEPEFSRIYWDDSDAFRWGNLVKEDELAKILRNTVVLM